MASQPGLTFLEDPGSGIPRGEKYVDDDLLAMEFRDNGENASFFFKHYELMRRLWLGGHAFVAGGTALCMLLMVTFQIGRPLPTVLYRLTFVGVVFTYGLSLLQNLNGTRGSFYTLLPLPTFQYTVLGALWLLTAKHIIKLAPYLVFSSLQLLSAVTNEKSSPEQKRLLKLADEVYAPKAMMAIGYLDFVFIAQLLWDVVRIRPLSALSFATFLFFYRVRIMSAGVTWATLQDVGRRVDHYMQTKTSEKVKDRWLRLKDRFVATDLRFSEMHTEDTNRAIENANLMAALSS